jgi:predicted SAM-dependent methyltransferase
VLVTVQFERRSHATVFRGALLRRAEQPAVRQCLSQVHRCPLSNNHVVNASSFTRQTYILFIRQRHTGETLIQSGDADETCPKLHVGCGPNLLAGWLNTDRAPVAGAFFLDANEPMAYPDATFGYVFSEHLIEHLDYPTGERFLRDSLRVLRTGGVLRTATPDLRFLVDLYSKPKNSLQTSYIEWATATFSPYAPTAADTFVINTFFRAWGHQFIYDEKTLRGLLVSVGFIDVQRCVPGQSRHPPLRCVEAHGRGMPEGFNELETLVLEATRPV